MKPRPQRADVIANRIRQKRQIHRDAVFLLVEGDDDAKFFAHVVNKDKCRVQPAYGRPVVEEALRILENADVTRIVAVIDSDFDALEYRAQRSPNLLRTDTHDIETMMLASPALASALIEHSNENAIDQFETQVGHSIREHLLALASSIGYARWLSRLAVMRLDFKNIVAAAGVVKRDWQTIHVEALLDELQTKSRQGILDRDSITHEIEALRSLIPDPWQLCNGHDLVDLLTIGLRSVLAPSQKSRSENRPTLSAQQLQRELRLAYQPYFRDSGLFQALSEWAQSHNVAIFKLDTDTSPNA